MAHETQKAQVSATLQQLNTALANAQTNGDHGTLSVHTNGRKFDLAFSSPFHNQTGINTAIAANGDVTLALAALLGDGGTFTLSVATLGGGQMAGSCNFTN